MSGWVTEWAPTLAIAPLKYSSSFHPCLLLLLRCRLINALREAMGNLESRNIASAAHMRCLTCDKVGEWVHLAISGWLHLALSLFLCLSVCLCLSLLSLFVYVCLSSLLLQW